MIDIAFKNGKKPQTGSLLVSDPFLKEKYFQRSVVLLCDHAKNGTFGFVLNNYITVDTQQIDQRLPPIKSRISLGGPVETNQLFFIHSFGPDITGSTPITNDLFFGGDYNQIQKLLIEDFENSQKIKFFLGYSGWEEGQLEIEIAEHAWLVADNISSADILSTKSNNLWESCLEKQGEIFKTIAKFPIDPAAN